MSSMVRRRFGLPTSIPLITATCVRRMPTRRLESLTEDLRELQDLLFAAETEGVLVILQGMDAAGKDVTIRNVFAAASPEAIRVKHFTEMTEEERAHDFLWRAHQAVPKRGELVIFDRSYYEQLILPQVLDEDDDVGRRRP